MSCPSADHFAELASGTATPELRAELADHAATCESCHAVLLDMCAVEATQIGRYRIERRLGAGAMGVVYAAYDPDLDRSIAIKLLRPGASADRLRREAQALAKLRHPNVVGVYDVGVHDDGTFVAMALVDGVDLREWLRTPRTTAQILDAIVQACRGVAAAHATGTVHRDLKPDNVFVGRDGVVLVGDFGLASTATEGVVAVETAGHLELTQTGTMLGTPAYMAPEQATGEATAASDQFSLAVTAWEALFGARPFGGRTIAELTAAARRAEIARTSSDRAVSARVVRALRRGLAGDPDARHASVAAFADALSPRRRRAAITVGLAAAALAGVLALTRGTASEADPCVAQAPFATTTPVRRVQVARSLAAVPGAASAFVARALRDIDAYADSYALLHHNACVAHVDITRCLDRDAATVSAVIDSIDARTAATTLARLEGLEPLDRCADPEPEPSAEAARLRTTLVSLDLRQRTEEPALLDTDLDALVARARATHDLATLAEALALAGASRIARGEHLDAERDLREAATLADGARDDWRRARALASLVELLAREGRLREAAAEHAVAVVALARGGSDPIVEVMVEHAGAVLAHADHDPPAEIAARRHVVELEVAHHGAVSISAALAWTELANALQGIDGREARRALAEGVRAESALVTTPDHPASVALSAANDAVLAGDFATAIREAQHAWLVADDQPSTRQPVAEQLATTYESAGDYREAVRAYDATVVVIEALPVGERDLAILAEALEGSGRAALEAIENFDDDRAIQDAMATDALASTERALVVARQLGPAGRDLVETLETQRGRAFVALRRWTEARPILEGALAHAEAEAPPRFFGIAMRAFMLARTLWEVGDRHDRARALALADQASRAFASARPALARQRSLAALLQMLDRQVTRLGAWRSAHRA